MFITIALASVLMAYVASQAAQEFRDDFLAACKHDGLSDEQIAGLLGISRGQFADQKAITQHLSAYRVADLPASIRVRLHTLQGERLGLTVIENGPLGEFLTTALSRRRGRTLKMALTTERRQEIA
jgi:hypothetical protein